MKNYFLQHVKLIYGIILLNALYNSVQATNEYCSMPFQDNKGTLKKTMEIPINVLLTYELKDNEDVYSGGFTNDPNLISLPQKHGNTWFIYSFLNLDANTLRIKEKNMLFINEQRIVKYYYLNGPFYLKCNLRKKVIEVWIADSKCMEIKYFNISSDRNIKSTYIYTSWIGANTVLSYGDIYISPICFESNCEIKKLFFYPKEIPKDSAMAKIEKTTAIGKENMSGQVTFYLDNIDYEILTKILYEKQSFIKFVE